MTPIDWIVLTACLLGTVAAGLYLSRLVKSSRDLFAAGGQSPWWLSGLSAFMTMFSANTFVVWGGIAYQYGVVAIVINLCYGLAAIAVGFTVAGHTSDEHPWFRESQRHGRNAYSDRYIWSPTTFCGPGQCDWAGDFVKGACQRDGNYLANFFYFQPALNYGFADPDPGQPWQLPTDHPSVCALREEMHGILRFWLDKGVDGFRVDMAASLIRGRDVEAVRRERQRFWAEIREWWDRDYPEAALIAEWSNPGEAVETGLHLDFMIHFEEATAMKVMRGENRRTIIDKNDRSYFDAAGGGDLQAFFAEMQQHLKRMKGRGLLSVPTGNHDLPRFSVDRGEAELKALVTFLFLLPSVPTLYYGDEIGMRHLHDLPSKEGAYRRTGARTPMQWTKGPGAGFSEAAEETFYLPLDPDSNRPNVAEQLQREDSLLQHVRALLALRRAHPALGVAGSFRQINTPDQPYPVVYERALDDAVYRVVVNGSGWAVPPAAPAPASPLRRQKHCSVPG